MIVFVSGGARSGKSSFAEELANKSYYALKEKHIKNSLYYVATAKRTDEEMDNRIHIHQQRRSGQWKTVEEPYDMVHLLLETEKGDVVLLDCLTIWLSNRMFGLNDTFGQLIEIVLTWLKVAKEREIVFIIVSNDVNEGVPIANQDVHNYIYNLENVHKEIISFSDKAIQMVAGIPIYWKGGGG